MLLQFFKKSPLFLCAVTMLAFTSCNEETPASDSTYDLPSNPSMKDSNENDGADRTDTRTIEVEKDAPQNSATEESDADVKINPPHGEPGHSCEIPVGQPLSSANSPVKSNAGNEATNNDNTANINPPHGEPGHSCEVPVGQPLPSSNSPIKSNVGNEPTNSGNTANINPPHGEPGHSCEVPVGQPLD